MGKPVVPTWLHLLFYSGSSLVSADLCPILPNLFCFSPTHHLRLQPNYGTFTLPWNTDLTKIHIRMQLGALPLPPGPNCSKQFALCKMQLIKLLL